MIGGSTDAHSDLSLCHSCCPKGCVQLMVFVSQEGANASGEAAAGAADDGGEE